MFKRLFDEMIRHKSAEDRKLERKLDGGNRENSRRYASQRNWTRGVPGHHATKSTLASRKARNRRRNKAARASRKINR